MRLTLKATLIGIVSMLVVLLTFQSWLAISRTQAIHANADDIATSWLPSVKSLGEIKFLVTRLRLNNGRIILTTDTDQRRIIERQSDEVEKQLANESRTYEKLITSPEEKQIWQRFGDKWRGYDVVQKRCADMANAGNVAGAAQLFNEDGFRAFTDVLAALDADIALNNKGADQAVSEAKETYAAAKLITLSMAAVSLAIGVLSALFVILRVTSPLQRLNTTMGVIAGGNLDTEIAYAARKDEIGDMAKALQIFKENGLRVREMEAQQKAAEREAAAQRKADMIGLADTFEAAVGEIIETVSSASTELESSASTLTKTADRTQQQATSVASASEQASANVQSVASATEEMASSVSEIGRQVQRSAQMAGEAVTQARTTTERVSELSKAATRIGDVIELINTIAGQTNLLALNATIEAARAGDAGRGFAVVASEVKALAEQTAKATGDIGQQIAGIQTATHESVRAIEEISGSIERLSEISSTIAAAVEEQGAATGEISRNVQQAAQGTEQVSSSITDVQRGATETGSASAQLLAAAKSLSTDSDRLKLEVGKFLNSVRAA